MMLFIVFNIDHDFEHGLIKLVFVLYYFSDSRVENSWCVSHERGVWCLHAHRSRHICNGIVVRWHRSHWVLLWNKRSFHLSDYSALPMDESSWVWRQWRVFCVFPSRSNKSNLFSQSIIFLQFFRSQANGWRFGYIHRWQHHFHWIAIKLSYISKLVFVYTHTKRGVGLFRWFYLFFEIILWLVLVALEHSFSLSKRWNYFFKVQQI